MGGATAIRAREFHVFHYRPGQFLRPYGQNLTATARAVPRWWRLTVGKQVPEFNELTKGTHGYTVDYKLFSPNVGIAWRPNVKEGFMRTIWAIPNRRRFGSVSPSASTSRRSARASTAEPRLQHQPRATTTARLTRSSVLAKPGRFYRDPSRLGPRRESTS